MNSVRVLSLCAVALALVLISAQSGEASNILLWMPFGSKSHYIVWQPLVTQLAKRNHSLTIVSPMDDKKLRQMPNVRFIHVNSEALMDEKMNHTAIFEGKTLDMALFMSSFLEAQDFVFANKEVQQLVEERPQFDVALTAVFCMDAGLYVIRNYFKAPVVYIFSGQSFPPADRVMGNPINPAVDPLMMFDFGQEMTFWERVQNALGTAAFFLLNDYYMAPKMEKKVQEVLKLDHTPNMKEVINSAEFTLFNAYPVFDSVKPINPNTAFVGGLHLQKAKPLPDDLKKWLDDAKEGVIYVSFGSILSGSKMPEWTKRVFTSVFSKLKQKVLWKWETEDMEGKPSNVMLKKWLPQQDVLGHPNVKLFITHAGLGSLSEGVYHGVPLIAMPGFADQFSNAAKAERKGFGIQINWPDLTEERLSAAINKILTSPKMAETAKEYSSIMQDELVHPLDRAVHHVEYVIRHKGAKHLRSPAVSLSWYQYYLLDVIALVFSVLAVIVFILIKTVKVTFGCFFGKSGKSKANSKKKNK